MTRDGGPGRPEAAPKPGRAERLAERLRRNLRRRKAQARARGEGVDGREEAPPRNGAAPGGDD